MVTFTPTNNSSIQNLPVNPLSPPLADRIYTNVKKGEALTTRIREKLPSALATPCNVLFGGFWSFFIAVYSVSALVHAHKLYTTCKVTIEPKERFTKIGAAVKDVFVDLIGLGGTAAYTLDWAVEANLISLRKNLVQFRMLGFGASLITSVIESGASLYHIHREKQMIAHGQGPLEQEEHKERLFLECVKLAGHVTMVAYAALGLSALILGLAFNPLFTGGILGLSCLLTTAAFAYDQWFAKKPVTV